jgi:outer membrane biosynthesis protein TonB
MMNRFARVTLPGLALSLGLLLAGCEGFDPTSIFDSEIFNTKKPLPGDRRPVFPEGTPGVPQGVPEELIKGHQPQQTQEPQSQPPVQQARPAEPKPKPKLKPKPKVVVKPKDESTPTTVTVRPTPAEPQTGGQTRWPDPPPMPQQQPATGGWAPSAGQVAWPDPPASR